MGIMWHRATLRKGFARVKMVLPLASEGKLSYLAPNSDTRGSMENVVLTIHLLLALALVGVVLLQRSEGGGLGLGGGGGGGGVMSGRSAASAMSKVTWILAVAFIITSLSLTVIAARKSAGASVIDRLGTQSTEGAATAPALPDADALLPPNPEDTAPLVPSAD
jgi:preprotein translocase subunit SecG